MGPAVALAVRAAAPAVVPAVVPESARAVPAVRAAQRVPAAVQPAEAGAAAKSAVPAVPGAARRVARKSAVPAGATPADPPEPRAAVPMAARPAPGAAGRAAHPARASRGRAMRRVNVAIVSPARPSAATAMAGMADAGGERGSRDRDGAAERGGRGASEARGASKSLSSTQRSEFRQSITRTNVRAVNNVNFSVNVGTAIPRSVSLHPLPPAILSVVPAYRGLQFILVGDDIVIIDPDTYEIVDIIPA